MPQAHPRPQPVQREARQKALAARKAEPKKLSLSKQFAALKRLKQGKQSARDDGLPVLQPMPAATPEQRRRDEDVRVEVQRDLCTAMVKGVRAVAGVWCSDEKAKRIEESPAVQELLSRTTGFVHGFPDLMKLPIVVGAKLL